MPANTAILAQHITDVLCLLFITAISFIVLLGWGSLIKRALGMPDGKKMRWSDGWIGLLGVIFFTETYHLWAPIDWMTSTAVLIIGAAGFAARARTNINQSHYWGQLPSRLRRHTNPLMAIVSVFLVFTWTSLALTTPSIYDGGLYHFQAIRWLNEFPIVLGLGNLSGRLAFNQSYFPYLALLNFSPVLGKGYAIGSLLLMALTSATLLESHLIRLRGGWWLNIWIMIALINISRYLSSPSPDVGVVLIQSACFIFLIRLYNVVPETQDELVNNAVMVFFLSCLLITIKFSAVFFATAAILLLLPSIKATFHQYRKLYLYVFLLGTCFVSTHLFRGILLSGLPLYPSTLGAIWNLDWSVSREQAISEANWIYSWSRDASKLPSEVLGSWEWLPAWSDQFFKDRWRYFYGAITLTLLDFILALRLPPNHPQKKLIALFIVFIPAIIFWFFTAPDWRFLGAIPQLLIGLAGWIFIQLCLPQKILTKTDRWPPYATASFVGAAILILMTKTADFKTLPLSGWQDIPKAEVINQKTASGLQIWIPAAGDQCWNSPLPCTPKINEGLHLRGGPSHLEPENLTQGFSVKE